MKQVQILAIEDVLAAATQVNYKETFEVDGITAIRSTLLQVVLDKGCTCVGCGAEAMYFAPFETLSTRGVHNLKLMFDHIADPLTNRLAYMTIDHIVPKSKGGPNQKDNYQPMCDKCNTDKGDRLDVSVLPIHLLKYVAPEFRRPHISRNHPLTPSEIAYEILTYKAYIRWFTITFHRKDHALHWRVHGKSTIRNAMKKSKSDFRLALFEQAFSEVVAGLKLPTSQNKQRHIRPGKIWADENKNKR